MDINLLVKISARAWSLRILALMHRGVPGRQASLLAATNAGRTAFVQSLMHLIDLELLERNPGHGHPVRPEYRLTPLGIEVAATAHRIDTAVPESPQATLMRRTWTVPILTVIGTPRSFSAIKTSLPAITDRALSLSLKQLQKQHWLCRSVDVRQNPPRASYRAANEGLGISIAAQVQA